MSRNTCPHLQTTVQINPSELCIQKKVNSHRRLDNQIMEFHDMIASRNTSNNNTDDVKMFIQFALADGKKKMKICSIMLLKCFLFFFFDCRANCATIVQSQDPISGSVYKSNAFISDALTSIMTTAHCISR